MLPAEEQGAQLRVVVSGAGTEGLPLHVALHPRSSGRAKGRHRVPLASGTAWLGLPPAPTFSPCPPIQPSSELITSPRGQCGWRTVGSRQRGGRGGCEGASSSRQEEEAGKEEAEARRSEEEEGEEEMVPALSGHRT